MASPVSESRLVRLQTPCENAVPSGGRQRQPRLAGASVRRGIPGLTRQRAQPLQFLIPLDEGRGWAVRLVWLPRLDDVLVPVKSQVRRWRRGPLDVAEQQRDDVSGATPSPLGNEPLSQPGILECLRRVPVASFDQRQPTAEVQDPELGHWRPQQQVDTIVSQGAPPVAYL